MALQEIKVAGEDPGKRIDILASEKTGISRSQIQKFIGKKLLLVNSKSIRHNYRVKANDIITLTIVEEETPGLVPEPLPIEILFKDRYLVVVNKPPDMVVYPAAGHNRGTLMNALSYHCKKLAKTGGPLRPGVVHRLDRDTSGVMVIALDDAAYYMLAEQFKRRTINRKYIAIIYGNIKNDGGEIALRIGRSETDRKKMSTRVKKGKEAMTIWKVVERFRYATLIEAKLRTGRTHQIRVHFASIGHPVLGDRTYGRRVEIEVNDRRKISFPRQMLHAELLGFSHPVTGEYLEFHSRLPEDMERAITQLRSLR
ncbi:MAG: RluA family pseudouridine synthase [Nitrospirae bacterium]|nr:RluA family pseudouridine synthase [Nitrospirota bacterium]